jgi:hypothetical protein
MTISGAVISFDGAPAPSITARQVSGEMIARQALHAVLKGTPFKYRFGGANMVVVNLRPDSGLDANAQAIELGTINLQDDSMAGYLENSTFVASKTNIPLISV